MHGLSSILTLGATLAVGASAYAADTKLPQTTSVTAYTLGTGPYNEIVAIAGAVKKKYNKDIRIIPANNDVSRMTPLRSGQVLFSAMGSGIIFVQEGLFEFGKASWGPQRFRLIALNLPIQSQSLIVSKDSGIKTYADLKGKRVPFVRNAPSLSELARAYLAFGGLSWKDVKPVEVAGFGAMQKAFRQGQIDTVIAATLSPTPKRAHASPVGPIFWLPVPRENSAGWKRLQSVAPYIRPINITVGPGINKSAPLEGGTYPLPVIISYPTISEQVAYSMAKAIVELYPMFKDATPSMHGYKVTKSHFKTIFPFHRGAVKFYKEIGLWGKEEDKIQAANLKRQSVLQAAWKEHKSSVKLEGTAFQRSWLAARDRALNKAGLPTYWAK